MSVQHQEFRGRVSKLQGKHRAMASGYSARVQKDGLIVVEPRRIRSRFSGRFVVLFLVAFLGFKAFLMAALGLDSYEERVARLATGTGVERAGAFVMQVDPISRWGAEKIGPILR
ncbi:hypothetical protein RSK20926_12309 [Roseobacter sp. SK209-2-6]|uniref:hypothetical protein n=1 Tax=Roseobacter sp. SK209-2-6 TaxID=388739 RepID=UPI0000F3C4DC|nr:hypothetical protein [Roseobacter sp. SK209-2-6]EBA18503.1 hypothetical protein RSK20926_12309 [Roseobacter sp. SK209-2-6]